jgi:protein SCO1/2
MESNQGNIKRFIMFGVLTLLTLGIMIWQQLVLTQEHTPPAMPPVMPSGLPVLGQVSIFILTDSQGQEFSSQKLFGKIWVANFFFTSCNGICPTLTSNMIKIHSDYANNEAVQQISISVDPQTDSPQVLAAYAEKYKANTTRWHFLTGAKAKINELFRQGLKISTIDSPATHSEYFILVDREHHIRGYYLGLQQEDVKRLIRDVALLLQKE